MLNKSKKIIKNDEPIWDVKHLLSSFRDPHLILIDLRSSGLFRGGPPGSPKEIPTKYHQGHISLALNLNLEKATSVEEVIDEIQTGMNSAGGSFLDTIILGITSGFHFLFYNQDGSNSELLFDLINSVTIEVGGEKIEFPDSQTHWLAGKAK